MQLKQTTFYTIDHFSGKPEYRKGYGPGGVYLWGFSMEENDYLEPTSDKMFFPYYVGKVYDDLYCRTFEHVASLVGGNQAIFDVKMCNSNEIKIGDILNNYKKKSKEQKQNGGPKLPNMDFPGLLHFPEGIHLSKQFLNDDAIQKQIKWMIKHFCITYFIPIENTKKSIDDLEKRIGTLVNYNRLITKKYNAGDWQDQIEIIDEVSNSLLASYSDIFTVLIGK